MQLSKSIIEWCKFEALSQVLSSFENEDNDPYSYEEVLEDLSNNNKLDILVWEPYEDYPKEWVVTQIESMYESYIRTAKFSLVNNWEVMSE